jgi:transposase InsO family protein
MDIHQNARSCAASRALLIGRYLAGEPMSAAAGSLGLSERRGWEWLRRHRQGEPLHDRSSAPQRVRRISDRERDQIVALRRRRWSCRRIARATHRSVATVARVVARAGLSRLRALDPPPPPVVRYEWAKPGELLHVDIKKLGRITNGGAGLNRHDRPGRTRGGGWEYAHVCIDDATRLAYVQMFPDERGCSAVQFLERAIAWFAARGVNVERVLTDNGVCYRSDVFRELCDRYRIKHKRTRPYRPQTNGKAERFNQTLIREWLYAFDFRSSAERTAALTSFLHYYNHHRAHTALGGQPPISRLLNNVLRRNT